MEISLQLEQRCFIFRFAEKTQKYFYFLEFKEQFIHEKNIV